MNIRTLLLSTILFCGLQHIAFAGDTASETKKVTKFTVIKIQGNFNVVFTPDADYSLKINGDKDAVAAVHASNTGTNLSITLDTTTKGNVTLYIGFKDILQLSIKGNDKITTTKDIKSDDLSLNLDGNTEGTLGLKVTMLTFTCNADKNVTITGKAEKANAKVEGDGMIDMSGFKVDDLTVDHGTDADMKIYAHPDLHIKMASAGNVTYYGNPKLKIFKVNGTGNPIEGK